MKKRIKIPYWINWIISGLLMAVLFTVFRGIIIFGIFGEAALPRIFSQEALTNLILCFSGIAFVGGYVIHGWLVVEETDKNGIKMDS